MRILYFTSREVWPVNTGARLRDYHFASQLARHAEVTLFGLTSPSESPPPASSADSLPPPSAVFKRVVMANKPRAYNPGKLLLGLLSKTPVTILNCTSPEIAGALAQLGRDEAFDSIQMEGVHLIRYLPTLRAFQNHPPILCDWHNIESELMYRYASTAGAARKLYALRTASGIAAAEKELLAGCETHTVCSERERAQLQSIVPSASIHVVENGVDIAYYADDQITAACRRAGRDPNQPARRLLYVGSMDYHANIDAVLFFSRAILPSIRKQHPTLNFSIVGRNPPPAVLELRGQDGIEVTGTVEDVRPYYGEAFAVVVPLRVGGGTRLKILEAFAAGVPVISTSLGAEGLSLTPGKEFLLADNAEEFSAAVSALTDATTRNRLIEAARQLVNERYDWQSLGNALYSLHARR